MGREIILDQTFEITDPEIQKKIIAIYQEAFDPKRLSLEDFDIHTYFDALLPSIANKFALEYIVLRDEDPDDKDRRKLRHLASCGLPATVNVDEETPNASKDLGVAHFTESRHAAYYMFDVLNDENYAQYEFAKKHNLLSGLGCPIFTDGNFVGLIMYYKSRLDGFAPEEVTFLAQMLRTVIQTIFLTAEQLNRSHRDFLELFANYNSALDSVQIRFHYAVNMLKTAWDCVRDIAAMIPSIDRGDPELHKDLEILTTAAEDSIGEALSQIESAELAEQRPKAIDDLQAFIEQSLTQVKFLLRNTEIELSAEPPRMKFVVEGNEHALRQLFLNIILNAQRAIDEASNNLKRATRGKITVSLFDTPDAVRVDICDNGVGMDEEQQSKVFARGQSFWSDGRGTGIGLSLCRKIAKDHGGSIRILTSKKGKGTTMSIVISKNYPGGATSRRTV